MVLERIAGGVPRGVRPRHHAVRPAARARLPLGGLRDRGRPARPSGSPRRVALASLPFGSGVSRSSSSCSERVPRRSAASLTRTARATLAGFILVVLGLTFLGLLPWPEGCSRRASHRGAQAGSSVLLGAAFAVCAAPCIGTVLASILVLAERHEHGAPRGRSAGGVLRGARVGLPARGRRLHPGDGRVSGGRDHYVVIRVASGLTLVALGLLLFFHRDWWLRVFLNRLLNDVGLGDRFPLSGRSSSVPRAEPPRPGSVRRPRRLRDWTGVRGVSRRAAFSSWRSQPTRFPRPAWYQATATWTSPWKKSRSAGSAARHACSSSSCAAKYSPALEVDAQRARPVNWLDALDSRATLRRGDDPAWGVDLFFRGKLDACYPATISSRPTASTRRSRDRRHRAGRPLRRRRRVPRRPALGFTNHTDTAGLRRANAAGFDQVVAKSALDERAPSRSRTSGLR